MDIKIDTEKLSEYLVNSNKFHYEAEILNYLDPQKNFHNMSNIEVYHIHFKLFNTLFNLKPILETRGFYLHIHFMKIGVVKYPSIGRCNHFDNVKLTFCEALSKGKYCEQHCSFYESNKLENIDSIAYFYLDMSNIDYFSENVLENWLSGMNSALKENEYFNEALSLLGLATNFDISTLKTKYRQLAKKYHPDTKIDGHKNIQKFLDINRAYQYLLRCLR